MTTGKNLLLSEQMVLQRNERYKLSDRSAVSECKWAYKQEKTVTSTVLSIQYIQQAPSL